jgi:hypothetical protein
MGNACCPFSVIGGSVQMSGLPDHPCLVSKAGVC